jgi:hypothetical protein
MQRLILTATLLIITTLCFSQNNDFGNEAVLKEQRVSAYKFLALLEKHSTSEAKEFIDNAFVKGKKNYSDSLTAYSNELGKYLKQTQLSVVGVFPKKGYNTFRCRYYNKSGTFYSIDLYFKAGQPKSLITKVVKVPEAVLIKDREAMAKRVKEEEKTGPLIPPSNPPPGVILQPVKKQ